MTTDIADHSNQQHVNKGQYKAVLGILQMLGRPGHRGCRNMARNGSQSL